MSKVEGTGVDWHGHVSALSVAPFYRRLKIADKLMQIFEDHCENAYSTYFIDLFVRRSNVLAVLMYKGLGYYVHEQVIGYYSGEDDAYGK